jgi:hypothetical protein
MITSEYLTVVRLRDKANDYERLAKRAEKRGRNGPEL